MEIFGERKIVAQDTPLGLIKKLKKAKIKIAIINLLMIGWFEGMRKIITTGQTPRLNLLISFSLNLIYLVLTALFFKWCFQKSKEKGLVRLE